MRASEIMTPCGPAMPGKFEPVLVADAFSYDPSTGVIMRLAQRREWFGSDRDWKIAQQFAGRQVKTATWHGYTSVQFHRQAFRAHRVAFAIAEGRWPAGEIDHINGIRTDNRMENLREVTHADNTRNREVSRNNTTGAIGVYRLKDRWQATIGINGITKHLGVFVSFQDAVASRKAAEAEYGFHPNHGRQPT